MGIIIIRDFFKLKRINQRQSDNLPDHVKGSATFETHQRLRSKANKNTGYYINSSQGKVAVEFITINGEDHWITLTTNDDAEAWYSSNQRIVPRDNTALGFWSTDDSQHPDFFIHHPEHAPSTSQEETLAGGLHHIATLQGATLFTPQEPILPQIEEAASQGISIAVDTAPAASILPTQQPDTSNAPVIVASSGPNTLTYIPANMSGQGGSGQGARGAAPTHVTAATGRTGQTITVAAASTNGRLKGTPPPMFDGDRDKSHKFLVDFHIYKFANRNNNAMSNPATHITTALTSVAMTQVDVFEKSVIENRIK